MNAQHSKSTMSAPAPQTLSPIQLHVLLVQWHRPVANCLWPTASSYSTHKYILWQQTKRHFMFTHAHTIKLMWGTPQMTLVRNLSSKGRPAHAHHLSKYISIINCTKPNHEKYLRHLSNSMQKVQAINFQDLNQGSTCTMLHAVSKACRC